jgi:hypothetical protein
MTQRVDQLTLDMAVVKSELHSHGPRLDAMTRDVAAFRNEVTEMRRGQEELHARLDRMQEDTNARFDRLREEAAARHAELLAAIRGTPPA